MILIRRLVVGTGVCAMALAVQAQITEVQPRHTRDYDERRDGGYCVVRLRVDDEVVVNIRGGRLAFETVRGRPAFDEGSECSQPMPMGSALANFRFRGVDGRGDVRLIEEPNPGNRYTARVRIRDTKGGDEGYTFRVEWENLNPGAPTAGVSGWGAGGGSRWGSGGSGGGSGWGSGGSNWGDRDMEFSTGGNGRGRMQNEADMRIDSAMLRLRRDGRFDLELRGSDSVRFSGRWQRDGNDAVLQVENGFSGGASGNGRASINGNEVSRITLQGTNRRTNASFNIDFSGRGGRGRQ